MVTRKRGVPALTPDDVRRIREGLGLSQVEAGELLGGGPRAFTKYESGTIKPTASVVNLLRLLDANPAALAALRGKRAAPIDTDGKKPFEITGRHIEALSARKMGVLTRRLLSAEAQSGDLPMDGIHVSAVITAADAGEDARIEWTDGPQRTRFLPSRLSQFQIKATRVSPSEAAAEVLTSTGEVKLNVRNVLGSGGTYILLCARSYTNTKIKEREDRIRKSLTEAGVTINPAQVQFRDADQIASWVNAHPPIAVWVLEQTQPGLAGPFRDWMHWAGRYEHESSPWVVDPRLEPLRDKLRGHITRLRGVVRVVGLSGVGKSRLVLEALGPTEEEQTEALRLSDLVLYAVESEAGAIAVKSTVQSLADASVRAVIVVDRCMAETHQDLAAMVKRSDSRLSLVTIDHEVPPKSSEDVHLIDPADQAVIDGMIKSIAPDLPAEDHRRLVKFSRGFPQMARLLGQSWLKEASVASASDNDLFDRIILGRKPSDPGLLKDAGMLLGAFGLLGDKLPHSDIHHVASLTRGRSVDDLRVAFDELLTHGVVQRHGRVLSLQPKPLAMALAERQWRLWGPTRWDEVLTGSLPRGLRTAAAHQLALLNDRAIATEVVRHVCRLNGAFSSLDALQKEGATKVLSSLSEVDTEAVVTLLEHVLKPLSASELQAIDGDVRRHIVWALQKIAFTSATFERGAMLLLDLAVSENEKWANNSIGQFKALFPVLLSDTEAGAQLRLRLLDELIAEDDPKRMPIVVDALLEGAKTHSFSRSVGSEVHGSRPALKPWEPKHWKEVWDYIVECLNRLTEIAGRADEIGARARAGLGRELRSLVARGLIDQVETWVADIQKAHRNWPEALAALGDVLQYDGEGLEPGVKERVRKLVKALSPHALEDRVRFLITEMPWDYPVDERLEFEERSKRQIEAIEQLARDLLAKPNALLKSLPQLSAGQQRMSYAFGRALAEVSANPLSWEQPIKDAVEGVASAHRNFGLLVGYYSGLSARDPRAVDAFKREAVSSNVFAPALPMVCASIGITQPDIALVREGLRTELIPPTAVSHWAYGGVLKNLPPATVKPLFDEMLNMDGETYSVAVDLMGMYVHSQPERLNDLRTQLRFVVSNVSRWGGPVGSQMGEHHFKEMVGWILAKGRDDTDARAIAITLAKQFVADLDSDRRDLIKPLLPRLFSGFASLVWPLFGQAIVKNRGNAWGIEHALGDSFSFAEEKSPAILMVPEDILFAWCHAYPDVGPAFVATIAPILTTQGTDDGDRAFHPLVKRLLDEFGDREDVLRKLSQNMHTFGWTGSLTTYFARYERPLRTLETHPIGAVRRWAKRMLSVLGREIEDARNEDDEQRAHWDM